MNRGNDPISNLIVESGLDLADYADVVDVLESVRDLVPDQAPVPSRELAALLARGVVTPLPPLRPHPRHRAGRPRAAVVTAAVAATVAVGTGVAAASNTLPEPAQRVLSQLSDKVLPFHIPSPEERDEGWRPDDDPFSQHRPGPGGADPSERRDAGAKPAEKPSGPAGEDAVAPGEQATATETGAPGNTAADVVPADPGETAPPQDEQQDKPAKSETAKPTEPPSPDPETDDGGNAQDQGNVVPPKGKPTAPPGNGQGDGTQEDPPTDPPDAQATPAEGPAPDVDQSRRPARGSRL